GARLSARSQRSLSAPLLSHVQLGRPRSRAQSSPAAWGLLEAIRTTSYPAACSTSARMLLPRPEIRIATRFGSRIVGHGPVVVRVPAACAPADSAASVPFLDAAD